MVVKAGFLLLVSLVNLRKRGEGSGANFGAMRRRTLGFLGLVVAWVSTWPVFR